MTPLALAIVFLPCFSYAAAATLAVSAGAVCGVAAGSPPHAVACAAVGASNSTFLHLPNVGFGSVSGGQSFFCGLRGDGGAFFCWVGVGPGRPKRVYNGPGKLAALAVGGSHVAAAGGNGSVLFWRGQSNYPPRVDGSFTSLTSGDNFSCAVNGDRAVQCWGPDAAAVATALGNVSIAAAVAGDGNICVVPVDGAVKCKWGSNMTTSFVDAPALPSAVSGIAVGSTHACALHSPNKTVLCWSAAGGVPAPARDVEFEFLVAGGEVFCGLTTVNLSVMCWSFAGANSGVVTLPLPQILPGVCVAGEKQCSCGVSPLSSYCNGTGVICNQCPLASSPQVTSSPPPSSNSVSKGWIAFAAIGGAGCLAGACAIAYCIFFGICRRKRIHNSVQPTLAAAAAASSGNSSNGSAFMSPPQVFRRQLSRVMQRQRSGPSSFTDKEEQFTLRELSAATKDFAMECKIGAGSFGTVYKGKLADGREVAIKRSERSPQTGRHNYAKESAFRSEIAFLSRLHHKHLVGLVGYCDEDDERLLVYEYMKNGALFDHLHIHPKNSNSGEVLPWKMRIKVLLDAARGIEYLHTYAVPPIIHRDIKSSNILLDGDWTAKVSDFGLSLMGPPAAEEGGGGYLSKSAIGTVGYIDPEYFGFRILTAKSDVYGFGVVMLETLTGRRAIFKDGGESPAPVSVVEFAVPSIAAGELAKVLDQRVVPPSEREAEAVELVAYTAVHCVQLEGKDRPAMSDIVANLENALALCDGDGGGGGGSSGTVSLTSVD